SEKFTKWLANIFANTNPVSACHDTNERSDISLWTPSGVIHFHAGEHRQNDPIQELSESHIATLPLEMFQRLDSKPVSRRPYLSEAIMANCGPIRSVSKTSSKRDNRPLI